MATVHFTPHLAKHVDCPTCSVGATTVRQALDAALADKEQLRGYVLDDQNFLRRHVTIYVDDKMIRDRQGLSDPVKPDSAVYVLQALSGG